MPTKPSSFRLALAWESASLSITYTRFGAAGVTTIRPPQILSLPSSAVGISNQPSVKMAQEAPWSSERQNTVDFEEGKTIDKIFVKFSTDASGKHVYNFDGRPHQLKFIKEYL